ncbi:hypothetical protein FBULB1_14144 [Fusarium bulbicola]|nr:hypothetical protein FBULB1_14144 [Fusarium bulbicola]
MFFRNQTTADLAKKNARALSTTSSSADSEVWKRPVSPPARDRATTFFMRQYVFDMTSAGGTLPLRDNHEFLPGLIRNQQSSFGLLSTTVAAAGFAALSNAGNVSEWRAEAFSLYDSAIRQLQSALQDPVQRVSDETLGAVLLMGTFETIAFADTGSLKAFSQHIIAAARCIEMRGPAQFQTVVGLKMFMQMRRIMSSWAERSQNSDLVPVNRFSEINEVLASVRAELKYHHSCGLEALGWCNDEEDWGADGIEHYGPSLARFPTKYFAWVFVPMDIISLILQGTGGGLSASSSGASQVGVDVAMAGLILQVIVLVAFSLLFGDYMFRYLRSKKSRNLGSRDKLFFAFLDIAVLATLARCVFRADELKEGYQGELIKHEDLFIALEGVLIVVAVFCLFVAHPGFVFNRPAKVYYSVATGTEATEEMTCRSKLADPVSESEH